MMVDFFGLHKEEDFFGHYDSSRYRMNQLSGSARLCAPTIPGVYRLSCIRDVKQVWKAMRNDHRREAFRKAVKVDHTKDEQFMCLGSVVFTVQASPRPVRDEMTGFLMIPTIEKRVQPMCFVTLEG